MRFQDVVSDEEFKQLTLATCRHGQKTEQQITAVVDRYCVAKMEMTLFEMAMNGELTVHLDEHGEPVFMAVKE